MTLSLKMFYSADPGDITRIPTINEEEEEHAADSAMPLSLQSSTPEQPVSHDPFAVRAAVPSRVVSLDTMMSHSLQNRADARRHTSPQPAVYAITSSQSGEQQVTRVSGSGWFLSESAFHCRTWLRDSQQVAQSVRRRCQPKPARNMSIHVVMQVLPP